MRSLIRLNCTPLDNRLQLQHNHQSPSNLIVAGSAGQMGADLDVLRRSIRHRGQCGTSLVQSFNRHDDPSDNAPICGFHVYPPIGRIEALLEAIGPIAAYAVS